MKRSAGGDNDRRHVTIFVFAAVVVFVVVVKMKK